MTLVETARVDLGALHNGRVAYRNIYEKSDGTRFIVDKGKRVPVVRINAKAGWRDIAYVTKGW
jgi:hypothetical protein